MLNDITGAVLSIAFVFAGFGALQYFGIFDITAYSLPFFQGFYTTYWMWLIPLAAIWMLAWLPRHKRQLQKIWNGWIVLVKYPYFLKMISS